MTHHEPDATTFTHVLELLMDNGFDRIASVLGVLLNESMRIERSNFLGAGPYERSDERRGYANGYKPKCVTTRVGKVDLQIPQVRDAGEDGERFYPSAMERGNRGERALKIAIAQMYIQGVSTRRVKKITEELCGVEISAWRTRRLESCRYVILDARYEKVRIGGSVISAAVLVALAIRGDGKRTILGVSSHVCVRDGDDRGGPRADT